MQVVYTTNVFVWPPLCQTNLLHLRLQSYVTILDIDKSQVCLIAMHLPIYQTMNFLGHVQIGQITIKKIAAKQRERRKVNKDSQLRHDLCNGCSVSLNSTGHDTFADSLYKNFSVQYTKKKKNDLAIAIARNEMRHSCALSIVLSCHWSMWHTASVLRRHHQLFEILQLQL